jgi:hypothetical protein
MQIAPSAEDEYGIPAPDRYILNLDRREFAGLDRIIHSDLAHRAFLLTQVSTITLVAK